jgi:spermidine synthase
MPLMREPSPVVVFPREPDHRALVAGIALSSFSALLLELGLTRLFSVVLFYHFAFLAISIALLGLGAGGVFAYLGKRWFARFRTRRLASGLCFLNALLVPVALGIVLHVPVSLELSGANFLRLTTMYVACAVPFLLTGLEFSVVFARKSRHVSRLYGADLAGGALACLGIVPLLNWLGGPNTILFAAVVAAVSGAVWAPTRAARRATVALAGALLLVIAANHSGRWIDVIYAKGEKRVQPEFARWNAISRVEVDSLPNGAKVVVIDADANTFIMNVDPMHWEGTQAQDNLMAAPPALANVLRPHGEFAIIGSGGGVDVLRALANGSPSVTGIEINPIIANTVMRDRYADYAQHLYQRPEVHMQVTDGRSFIRNAGQSFDVVQMTLVDTWASTAAGAFALSENSLYTVEAFQEYFEHLKPDGMVAVTRWEFRQPREALRVVSVAMDALHRLGVKDPRKHFIVVSDGALDEDGIPVVVLAKKSPFTPEEEGAVKEHFEDNPDLVALYLPSVPGDNAFSRLIAGNDPYAFAKQYPYNVAPVNDNRPFFFFTLKIGQVLHQESLQQGMDWKVNLGVAVLVMVLVISLVAVLAFLIVPLAVRGRPARAPAACLLYFVAVGLGYILVEIAFIQRFVLFLGHPTYALTVVVFLLLLSSGGGSLASRPWLATASRTWMPLLFIVAALLLYVFILPGVLNAWVGLPFPLKLIASAGLLVPLGFAMGMPFPAGLHALGSIAGPQEGDANHNAVEWAWAVNAGSSVLGSVLAIMIAIQFGLNVTLACGAAAYFLAVLLTGTLRARPVQARL